MTDILQRLHDSEINFTIESFWDGGFDWKLGDVLNGFKAKGKASTLADTCHALALAAVEHYPNSEFAKTWREHEGAH